MPEKRHECFFLIEFVAIRCSPGFQFCNENALRLFIRAATIDNIAKQVHVLISKFR